MDNADPSLEAQLENGPVGVGTGQSAPRGNQAVVLFDGVCNLCNAGVNFIIDRDPRRVFRFAALQSPIGQEMMRKHGLDPAKFDTVVLVEEGRAYTRSSAALRILRLLRGGWALLYPFMVVPAPVRDAFYRFIARRRYGWFGQSATCRVPTPDIRDRFLT